MMMKKRALPALLALTAVLSACNGSAPEATAATQGEVPDVIQKEAENRRVARERMFTSEPLVTHIYTADPSAHVWDGKLYIYPSHDIETDIPMDDTGAHFAMRDYHILSMDKAGGEATDNGVALSIDDVPWAGRQMWAPDAARKGDKYYLYFPAKDKQDIFRIGVAVSDSPTGPFAPLEKPIPGSYSIDPTVFEDNGEHYLYFGGIWGGQLQRWQTGEYVTEDSYPADDEPALAPMVAKLSGDMLSFAEQPKKVLLQYEDGSPIPAGDNDKRFFEATWLHKYGDTYYFSYSTGDTHNIAYATGDNPYGPFTYRGILLEPVLGWTNHHSIAEFNDQWYLFYHDTQLSGGQTHLRNVKMMPLAHNNDGSIQTMSAFAD